MKINVRSVGAAELEDSDLASALRHWAIKNKTNSKELSKMVTDYLTETKGVKVFKIQKSDDLSKIVAEVEFSPENALPERKDEPAFRRKFNGFYSSVRAILEVLKTKKKKNYIEFEDLYKILLEQKDDNGDKLFVKDGQALAYEKFRQYLTESQINPRPPKRPNPSMKGVKHHRNGKGLDLSNL